MARVQQVLAWSISTLRPTSVLAAHSKESRRTLGQTWADASHQALITSDWDHKAQVRPVQAILLRMCYRELRAQPADSDATAFHIWHAAAARTCQLLGFHKLGKDPSVMPKDDPAFPPGSSSLKRELAKRIWTVVVALGERNISNLFAPPPPHNALLTASL